MPEETFCANQEGGEDGAVTLCAKPIGKRYQLIMELNNCTTCLFHAMWHVGRECNDSSPDLHVPDAYWMLSSVPIHLDKKRKKEVCRCNIYSCGT